MFDYGINAWKIQMKDDWMEKWEHALNQFLRDWQEHQITSYLTQLEYLLKYVKKPFPDDTFKELFLKAMECRSKEVMLNNFEKLLDHLFRKIGGFNIDGWTLRTSVE